MPLLVGDVLRSDVTLNPSGIDEPVQATHLIDGSAECRLNVRARLTCAMTDVLLKEVEVKCSSAVKLRSQ